jgi:hypothetical protein
MLNLASTVHFNLRSDFLRIIIINEPSASENPLIQCGFKLLLYSQLIIKGIIGIIEEIDILGPLPKLKGFIGLIPNGGQEPPISIEGDRLEWKKAQNTERKANASLIINRTIP